MSENNSNEVITNNNPTEDETGVDSSNEGKIAEIIDDAVITEDEGEEIKPIKTKKKSKAKARDSKARTASAAVFFNDNRSIAGFGNSMRAVFTSIRELVENSLDASENRGVTPVIDIQLRKLKKKELIKLMGTTVIKSRGTRLDFLELSCKDNGVGVERELIPQLFGTVLAGTKYGAQQTRGRFGLGSKMVLLYAMSTLDLPIQITTRSINTDKTHRVKLFIDLEKNAPIIVSDEVFEQDHQNYFNEPGTEIKVSFTGSWNLAKTYVREYFRQLGIITPYADIRVQFPGDEAGTTDTIIYQRVVDEMPNPPEVIKVHPWGTDISNFRREIGRSSEDNLLDFLTNNFMGVNRASAEAFFEEVNVPSEKSPKDLTSPEIRRIIHDGFNRALKESKTIKNKKNRIFKFDDPKGDALSPLGADRLRRGLEKELNPDFVEALTRPPRAYAGHPFIIEAALGYGGGVGVATSSKGVTVVDNRVIYRYANRIPLIFGAGSDLITNIVNSLNWSDYGLTRGTEPLAIAVSLVSTKIPFPETSKEYIDKVEEIGAEVKMILMQLGRKLKTFLGRTRRRQRERQRKSRFERFAPQTVHNLLSILEKEGIWNPTTGVNPSRIITALSSGTPRIGAMVVPHGISIFQSPIWSNVTTQQKLQDNSIHEISSFFRTPNKKLAKILGKNQKLIDLIKRRTIDELDQAGEIPSLDSVVILDSEIERRFHQRDSSSKAIELPRLSKALSRRWIRNSYDYLVTPTDKLPLVQGLTVKLVEAEKYQVIKKLFETISETDLLQELSTFLGSGAFGEFDISTTDKDPITVFFDTKKPLKPVEAESSTKIDELDYKALEDKGPLKINIVDLIPPPDILYKFNLIKKRKVSSVLEFLLETSNPSAPYDEKTLAPLLIPHFKKALLELVAKNKNFGKIKVDVSSQQWIDGYLRNAFKRRNISTINDIIKTDDKVLQEIGELQRIVFSGLMQVIIPKEGIIQSGEFSTKNNKAKIKILDSNGINTLEIFAATPSIEIATDKKYWKFVELLLEESKEKIIDHLTLQNQLGALRLLKEITPDLETDLFNLDISSTTDLLVKPLIEFDKKIQKRIQTAKIQIGRNFDGFSKPQQDAFSEAKISVLEELVFYPSFYLNQELPESTLENLKDALDYLMMPASLISPNLNASVNILRDAGVTTVGKFLVWPGHDLSRITDMSEEWLNLIRESFSIVDLDNAKKTDLKSIETISHLLSDNYIKHLSDMGINNIPQAAQIRWGDIFPKYNELWTKISEMDSILTDSLINLSSQITNKKKKSTLTSIFNELASNNIKTLLQFIRLPLTSISQNVKGKRKKELIGEFYQDLHSNQPKLIPTESIFYAAILTYRSLETLKSPIVYLSEFKNREIELLNNVGIKTLNQLFCIDKNEISRILGKTSEEIGVKLDNSILRSHGTPLAALDNNNIYQSIIIFEREGINYFTTEEITYLLANGYDTIESLYYMSDHRTFEVSGLNWEVINHFKKLLRSPPVLITWKKIIQEEIKEEKEVISEASLFDSFETDKQAKKEKTEEKVETKPKFRDVEYYETFSSKELEKLTKANITRVIDFCTESTENLSKLLDWDADLTKTRQTTIIIQEAGISLSDLGIFRQAHSDHLSEIGLVTIEDLYFTAKEESWDSSILPWEPINTVKRIIRLNLSNAVEELGQDMVDILKENEVENILELLLTGDPILEQKTGLPAERFENLKYALDFGELIQAFDKSVLFTPELNFFQIKKLIETGYTRILDIVLADASDIAKVLEVPAPYAVTLLEGINRTTIQKTEEERGIMLKDINAFSRSDLRSIAKSGIFEMNTMDTLQEVIHQLTPDIFQGEEYLLNSIINLQKVGQIPLKLIGDLNSAEIEILEKHRIHTIADALMIGYDDLEADYRIHNALTNISKSIIDLKPFLALGILPSIAAMQPNKESDGKFLLETWLKDGKLLHKRTMSNIRGLLSIPIRLTSFAKNYKGHLEELGDKTVADILLEYTPDEDHPNAILKDQLKQQGSIIKLLREGSTPVSLLDLDPKPFRTLMENGISTMERLMLNDEKQLSSITGLAQKYWKSLKELFDPEIFSARLGDIGLSTDILSLSKEENEKLDDLGIEYIDQVTVFEQSKGIIKEINNFLSSSPIFLAGSPGERELAIDAGAISVLEAIMALRKSGADTELTTEAISMGWQAYRRFKIDIPDSIKKDCNKQGIYSIQDLITFIELKEATEIPENWQTIANPFQESPLLLPLSSGELQEIVKVHRCSNIIEAITSPMTIGKITEIKNDALSGKPLPILSEIKIPGQFIQKISSTSWKRIEKSKVYIQEIISSPRTLDEYKGIKQKILQEIRQQLRLPLSRIHINGKQLIRGSLSKKYLRLTDIVYDQASLYQKNPQFIKTILLLLESDNFKVIPDKSLNPDLQKAAETALGVNIQGFHDLWTATTQGANILSRIDTKPAMSIKNYIEKSSHSIEVISGITPAEIWKLVKCDILTLSDLILKPEPLLSLISDLTKKRVIELQNIALETLNTDIQDNSISIRTIAKKLDESLDNLPDVSLFTVLQKNKHPLNADKILSNSLRNKLQTPFIITGVADKLDLRELKSILGLGILSISDFLIYHESMNKLPETLSTIDDRMGAIKALYFSSRKDIDLSAITLPVLVKDAIGEISKLSELISFVLTKKDPEMDKCLFIKLRYSGLENQKIIKLESQDITTVFDFLIAPPELILDKIEETEDWLINFIKQLDFPEMITKLKAAPFQIDKIENLSANGKKCLKLENIHTLLDLNNILPTNLNRSDGNYLKQIQQILNAPYSLLSSQIDLSTINAQLREELGIYTINSMILASEKFDTSISDILRALTIAELQKIVTLQRKLAELEDISARDEVLLVKSGIFEFKQLSETSKEKLSEIGLKSDNIDNLLEILSSPWSSIINLDQTHREVAEASNITTVAELLSVANLQFKLPIRVNKEIKLSEIFGEQLPDVFNQKKIDTLTNLLSSKVIVKEFSNNNSEIQSMIASLHTWVGNIPKISSKWVSKLENANINRVWQYLQKDINELATICSSSVKAQSELQSSIFLKDINNERKMILPTMNKEDKELLQTHGIYSIKELMINGWLNQFIESIPELISLIQKYNNVINLEIWKIEGFWNIDQVERRNLAPISNSILDLLQIENKHADLLIIDGLNDNFSVLQSLEDWITDETELSELSNIGITSIQSWLFNKAKGRIAANRHSNIIFRSTLEIIPDVTIKQILTAYQNSITHISDILLMDHNELAKKFGTNKSKILAIIEKIKSLSTVRPKLPKLGLVTPATVEALSEAGLYSWSQLIGNVAKEEIDPIKGITWISVMSLKEQTKVPLWYNLDLRKLGLEKISKLTRVGVKTIDELLMIGNRLGDILEDHQTSEKILESITRANLNKGKKHTDTKLSLSNKLKASQIPEFNKIGIHSPIDIFIKSYSIPKESPLNDGIEDWIKIGDYPIESVDIPDQTIAKLKSLNINFIKEAMIMPDSVLREGGVTNNQIKLFRKTLNRKKGWRPPKLVTKPIIKKTKPAAKKVISVKKSVIKPGDKEIKTPTSKSPVKKAPTKKAPVKKSPVKMAPVKKSPVKKAPVKKAPVKKSPVKKAPVKKSPAKKSPAKKAIKKPSKKKASKKKKVSPKKSKGKR